MNPYSGVVFKLSHQYSSMLFLSNMSIFVMIILDLPKAFCDVFRAIDWKYKT